MLDEFQLLENVKENRKGKLSDSSRVIRRLLDNGKLEQNDFYRSTKERIELIYQEVLYWVNKGLKMKNGRVPLIYSEFLMLRGYMIDVPEGLQELGFENVATSHFVFQEEELKILFEKLKFEYSSFYQFVVHINTLDEQGVLALVTQAWEKTLIPETLDLTRSLVFVVGNIDQAYSFAQDQTSDISPDEFYALSRKIKLPHMKKALKSYFRNEQISRLGNNHVIYPSLNSEAYRKIITSELKKINDNFKEKTQIPMEFDQSVVEWLFEEGVAATQGVRPLLSTIRYSIGDVIPKILLAYHRFGKKAIRIKLSMNDGLDVEYFNEKKTVLTSWIPIDSKIKKLKKTRGDEFQAIVAVHESGHAILHFQTKGKIPKKVVSVCSDPDFGGFVISDFQGNITTYDRLQKEVMVSLGGFIAETLVFGERNVSNGSAGDFENLTEKVLFMFKECGFGSQPIRFAKSSNDQDYSIHKMGHIEEKAELFIQEAFEEAKLILRREEKLLVETAKKLLENSQLEPEEFRSLIVEFGTADLIQQSNQNAKTFKEMLLEKSDQLMADQSTLFEKSESKKAVIIDPENIVGFGNCQE